MKLVKSIDLSKTILNKIGDKMDKKFSYFVEPPSDYEQKIIDMILELKILI